jgi:calcium permeable stress-gated cation channel
VERASTTFIRGARNVSKGLDNLVETTSGFVQLNSPQTLDDDMYDQYGRYRGDSAYGDGRDNCSEPRFDESPLQTSSHDRDLPGNEMRLSGIAIRRANDQYGGGGASDPLNKKWFEFWKAPSGGFASPVPTGYEDGNKFPLTQTDGGSGSSSCARPSDQRKGFWLKIKTALGKIEVEPLKYPTATNPDYREDSAGAAWEKYLKPSERPKHRLAFFGWLPAPLIGKKVDAIYCCRSELARLNLEIEVD